ncbi:sigma-54-dependent transcriptional regulator [Carboxylicivirga sp. RSCT41]|uniref:sigma-54-dependent transcriptional regulator n=1 Tax=Carboxylicivirga agarovorans TaxID=3417570 RepID=UPI003D352F54
MKILVVEDDALSREAIVEFLSDEMDFDTQWAKDATVALEMLQADDFQLIVSDIKMPGISGIELLKRVKQNHQNIDVILMTGFSEINNSIEALRWGASDYLLKPVNIEELSHAIQRLQDKYQLLSENSQLKASVEEMDNKARRSEEKLQALQNTMKTIQQSGNLAVFSNHMRQVVELSMKFHDNRDIPVLIQGETGTGKEMIARLIHYGENKDLQKPFIPVNCAALSPQLFESELFGYEKGAFTGASNQGRIGKMELAQGGTLFLDEIGELQPHMQAKLLRVLQQKEFYRVGGDKLIKLDVRFVFATNRNLKQMIRDNTFRSDLYFRMESGTIELKPLRHKPEEIVPLAQYFMELFNERRNKNFRFISKPARSILEKHPWPGNVRELENAIERIVLLYDETEIQPRHLSHLYTETDDVHPEKKIIGSILVPGEISLPDAPFSLEHLELEIVDKALKRFNGSKSKAAEYLGISRFALRSRLRKLEERNKHD